MTRTRGRILALVGGLVGLLSPGAAWAHHPGPGAAGPWAWLALLLIGLALVMIWPVLTLLERRQKPPSKRRPSKR